MVFTHMRAIVPKMESIIVLIVPDCPIIEPSMVVVLDYRFEALMVRDPVFFLSLGKHVRLPNHPEG